MFLRAYREAQKLTCTRRRRDRAILPHPVSNEKMGIEEVEGTPGGGTRAPILEGQWATAHVGGGADGDRGGPEVRPVLHRAAVRHRNRRGRCLGSASAGSAGTIGLDLEGTRRELADGSLKAGRVGRPTGRGGRLATGTARTTCGECGAAGPVPPHPGRAGRDRGRAGPRHRRHGPQGSPERREGDPHRNQEATRNGHALPERRKKALGGFRTTQWHGETFVLNDLTRFYAGCVMKANSENEQPGTFMPAHKGAAPRITPRSLQPDQPDRPVHPIE